MALGYILEQFCRKIGITDLSDPSAKSLALKYINPAAKELYNMSDMAGCLDEQCFQVNSNQEISFPSYIGQIRAMRDAWWYGRADIKLSQMRPNYNQFSWADSWKNWRVKNLRTLQASLKNQSQVLLTVKAVESTPVVVNISGPGIGSTNQTESITMSSTQMNSQNAYLDITAFTKTSINQYDVVMTDIDGNQISSIPNNQYKASYQIIDVSMMPYTPINAPVAGWIEVLYKKSLPILQNDSDEFPAIGYDDVIWNKALQLYWEEQPAGIQQAMEFSTKSGQLLAQIHEDANRGTDDVVSLVSNPHDSLNPRVGWGRDFRYSWKITGR
jgi:hypothetical protein